MSPFPLFCKTIRMVVSSFTGGNLSQCLAEQGGEIFVSPTNADVSTHLRGELGRNLCRKGMCRKVRQL